MIGRSPEGGGQRGARCVYVTVPANQRPLQTTEEKPVTQSAVFSMFGGGAKKEKKEEEDRGDVSGSAKAQREAAAAAADDVSLPLVFMCDGEY